MNIDHFYGKKLTFLVVFWLIFDALLGLNDLFNEVIKLHFRRIIIRRSGHFMFAASSETKTKQERFFFSFRQSFEDLPLVCVCRFTVEI
jgi:hypothetical protein